MPTISLPYTRKKLNEFASSQWSKTLSFLKSRFSLSQEDCEDIFQESFIIFYNYAVEGKLDNIKAAFSTYFNSICRNKALELLKRNGREINIIDEYPNQFKDEYEDDKIDSILALEDDSENIQQRKSALVYQIVQELPEPCDRILWGFYGDGFSMKTLADMLNYTEGSIKVTKYRCSEKFRKRYSELVNQL